MYVRMYVCSSAYSKGPRLVFSMHKWLKFVCMYVYAYSACSTYVCMHVIVKLIETYVCTYLHA